MNRDRPRPQLPKGGAPPPLQADDAAVEPRVRGPVIRAGAQSAPAVWED